MTTTTINGITLNITSAAITDENEMDLIELPCGKNDPYIRSFTTSGRPMHWLPCADESVLLNVAAAIVAFRAATPRRERNNEKYAELNAQIELLGLTRAPGWERIYK